MLENGEAELKALRGELATERRRSLGGSSTSSSSSTCSCSRDLCRELNHNPMLSTPRMSAHPLLTTPRMPALLEGRGDVNDVASRLRKTMEEAAETLNMLLGAENPAERLRRTRSEELRRTRRFSRQSRRPRSQQRSLLGNQEAPDHDSAGEADCEEGADQPVQVPARRRRRSWRDSFRSSQQRHSLHRQGGQASCASDSRKADAPPLMALEDFLDSDVPVFPF